MFGWQFKNSDESLPIEYYRIETPSIMGGLLKRLLKHRQWNMAPMHLLVRFRWKTSIEVPAKILAQGGIVAMDKFAIPGRAWHGFTLSI